MNPDFEITTTEVPTVNASDQFTLPEEVDAMHPPMEDQWTAKNRSFSCVHCWRAVCSWFTSPMGISLLLMLYLTLGAVMFMILGTYYGNWHLLICIKHIQMRRSAWQVNDRAKPSKAKRHRSTRRSAPTTRTAG